MNTPLHKNREWLLRRLALVQMEINRAEAKTVIVEQSDLAEQVREFVRRRLNEIGMSQLEFARRLGCTQSNISQMLAGRWNVQLRDVSKWAAALGCRAELKFEELATPHKGK